jgi:hypothetical protein
MLAAYAIGVVVLVRVVWRFTRSRAGISRGPDPASNVRILDRARLYDQDADL